MQTTGNLGLKLPEADDTADIADLNYNASILDNRIGAVPVNSDLQTRTAAMEGRYSTGVLKIANGGSGMSSNPSMLANLGSTSADNVFKASPRPGVTGTLPIANGGTGLTSSPSMLTNLGSTNADNVLKASPRPGVTGTLPVGNGGTGSANASGARSNLGLGNAATQSVANNLTTDTSGYVLDARQGKALNERISDLVKMASPGITTDSDGIAYTGLLVSQIKPVCAQVSGAYCDMFDGANGYWYIRVFNPRTREPMAGWTGYPAIYYIEQYSS